MDGTLLEIKYRTTKQYILVVSQTCRGGIISQGCMITFFDGIHLVVRDRSPTRWQSLQTITHDEGSSQIETEHINVNIFRVCEKKKKH